MKRNVSPAVRKRLLPQQIISARLLTHAIAALGLVMLVGSGCATKPRESSSYAPLATLAPATPPAPSPPAAQPPQEVLPAEALAKPPAPFDGEGWESLFDGQTLTGWQETQFGGRGEVQCRSGVIVLNMGDPFTGISYTNPFPKMNYEIAFDAMRVMGTDFFCGLTVPVGTNFCSLIVGGWGGSLMGISSLDGLDASENEATKYINFERGRWYRIRMRVTTDRIEMWLDADKMIDLSTRERRISLRPGEIEKSKPMGIASWQTTSALRAIKVRSVTGPADPLKGPR